MVEVVIIEAKLTVYVTAEIVNGFNLLATDANKTQNEVLPVAPNVIEVESRVHYWTD